MKIAVTYENGEIFQHFGKTEYFLICEVNDGKVVYSEIISSNGNGHGALAVFLAENGVDTLICGGIGEGAQNALKNAGIKLYGGNSGNADIAVKKLIAGTLEINDDFSCSHHSHGGAHSCGSHKCG